MKQLKKASLNGHVLHRLSVKGMDWSARTRQNGVCWAAREEKEEEEGCECFPTHL